MAMKLVRTAMKFVKANGDKGSGAEALVTGEALRKLEAEVSFASLSLH
jgi:hypothetical protein